MEYSSQNQNQKKAKELFQIKEWKLNVVYDNGLDPLSGEVLFPGHYEGTNKIRVWNVG